MLVPMVVQGTIYKIQVFADVCIIIISLVYFILRYEAYCVWHYVAMLISYLGTHKRMHVDLVRLLVIETR